MTIESLNSNERKDFKDELYKLEKSIEENEGNEENGDEYEYIRDTLDMLNAIGNKKQSEFNETNIKAVQIALKIEGYEIGEIGIYGEKDKNSVKKFQMENNLKRIDGILGKETISKLIENLKKKMVNTER